MIDYDEFQTEVRRLRRERWARIVAAEPPVRPRGGRPRDPEQEAMLLRMDRARLERENPDLLRPRPAPRREPAADGTRRLARPVDEPIREAARAAGAPAGFRPQKPGGDSSADGP